MKKSARWLLTAGMVIVGLAAVSIIMTATQNPPQKVNVAKTPTPTPIPLPCNGPDLAVTQLSVKAQNINGKWWAVVQAQVINKGSMDFDAKPGQAVTQLILKKLWAPGEQSVMTSNTITHLGKGAGVNAGGSFLLSDYLRADCTQPLKPNECCHEIQIVLKIVYDPDIRNDGNPANDDCNAGNDTSVDTPDTHLKYTVTCIKIK
jgi:hypothetical protein